MKTKYIAGIECIFAAVAGTLHAGQQTSANYSIPADTVDAAGARSASVNYTNDGSLGGVTGVSSIDVPAETVKHGYIGQLYEITGLEIAASPDAVNEGETLQTSASQVLDDDTQLAVPPEIVAWSVLDGPLVSIDAAGLATADIVYTDTSATVQGVYLGATATLGVTVLDSIPDNYGTYAGDGIGDDWQIQYFGLDNPLAAPGLDPDGDGQTNLFEYIAGVVPTDPLSLFRLRIEPVPGQPGRKYLIFSPRLEGRVYTVESSASLLPADFATLPDSSSTDDGDERTVTDLGATGARKFYRVEISVP